MEQKKAPPPPPPRNGNGDTTTAAPPSDDQFVIESGVVSGPQKILIYGPGGVGKSTLAALAPGPVFIDIESGSRKLNVPRIKGISDFENLKRSLLSPKLDSYQTVVIDSATMAEELAIAHTIKTVKHDKPGITISSVESYGFGKGLQHVYDTFLILVPYLERQLHAGRNVILIAHECISDVPNPAGENFIRYEPRLQSPKSGKASIRNRLVEWCDHVLFIGYDVAASDGKGRGTGTRTIYTSQTADHIAKSRQEPGQPSCDPPFDSPTDGSIWAAILGGAS
jgi:hypothetical protein